MACEYFTHEVGNSIAVIVGEGYELGKFWFNYDGESTTPITKAEAETLAKRFVEYFEKEHPITEEMAERYGDSEDAKSQFDEFQQSARALKDASGSDSKELMLKLMLAKVLCGD